METARPGQGGAGGVVRSVVPDQVGSVCCARTSDREGHGLRLRPQTSWAELRRQFFARPTGGAPRRKALRILTLHGPGQNLSVTTPGLPAHPAPAHTDCTRCCAPQLPLWVLGLAH